MGNALEDCFKFLLGADNPCAPCSGVLRVRLTGRGRSLCSFNVLEVRFGSVFIFI